MHRLRAFIVEDNPIILEALEATLAEIGDVDVVGYPGRFTAGTWTQQSLGRHERCQSLYMVEKSYLAQAARIEAETQRLLGEARRLRQEGMRLRAGLGETVNRLNAERRVMRRVIQQVQETLTPREKDE